MDAIKLKDSAKNWIDSWNKRDLEKIMDHYADDVELYSPIVTSRWNIPEGNIHGKEKLREHFGRAFEGTSSTTRKLLDMLLGVNSLILVYQDEIGTISADLVEFNDAGKVKLVKAYYTAPLTDSVTKS